MIRAPCPQKPPLPRALPCSPPCPSAWIRLLGAASPHACILRRLWIGGRRHLPGDSSQTEGVRVDGQHECERMVHGGVALAGSGLLLHWLFIGAPLGSISSVQMTGMRSAWSSISGCRRAASGSARRSCCMHMCRLHVHCAFARAEAVRSVACTQQQQHVVHCRGHTTCTCTWVTVME